MSSPVDGPIVLLHGALGAGAQLQPLAASLAAQGVPDVRVVEFAGHGATPDTGGAFTVERFGEQVLAAMDAAGAGRATLFGYSMGGYVALHLAATRPERVARVVTLATKLAWTPEVAAREAGRLDAATIRAKVPRFAEQLADRHGGAGGWELVLARTAALLRALGEQPPVTDAVLRTIASPVRVLVGDRDATVTLEECAAAYRALPDGALGVLARTGHPLEQVEVRRLVGEIVGESAGDSAVGRMGAAGPGSGAGGRDRG